MAYEQLKLDNQLCFALYAASHVITRRYKPFLDTLGITYPQYLVLMVLWEHDEQTVNAISQKLLLNTNTVTPLLKRMETLGLIRRERSKDDERKVNVQLSKQGKQLEELAKDIPQKLATGLIPDVLSLSEVSELKDMLAQIIENMKE